jgi:hypothetical protein
MWKLQRYHVAMSDIKNLGEDTSKQNNKGNKRKLAEERYTFRSARSTTDLFFGIRQLIEKNWEYGKEFTLVFIDCKKASESMKREEIWKT